MKKNEILEISLAVFILLMTLTISIIVDVQKKKEALLESQKIKIVEDESRYFTVLNIASKYIDYINSKDYQNVLYTLDLDYKNENSIGESNVSSFVPNLDENNIYSYIGTSMQYRYLSKNVSEYYIHGYIELENIDENVKYMDYDLTIKLYESENIFSIRPGVNNE